MPDSFGKRQRDQVKARKAAARDERRVARNKRKRGDLPTQPEPFSADAPWEPSPRAIASESPAGGPEQLTQ